MFESLFRNTLSSGQWALLALVPPAILALYFLKLKRVPVEVPSTYLWLKAIEDLHVNSLWQKLRKSLLLFLQLAIVGLAILALLRPGWQGTKLTGERFILLIDNSASMTTTDTPDHENRLAAAKAGALALVEQLESDMSAMVISYAGEPRVVQEFTDNRRRLREAIETIGPTAESTDLLGALKLAEGVANPGQVIAEENQPEVAVVPETVATMYLFTDGRTADVKEFTLGNLEPVFVPVGSAETNNLAITAMSTRRSERFASSAGTSSAPGDRQAFVQVTNLADKSAKIIVELLLDGSLLDAQSTDVAAGDSSGITFPLADAPPGKLTARISPESLVAVGDAFAQDNTAYAALNDVRPGRVLLVSTGNVAIETALATGRATRFGDVKRLPPRDLESKEYQTLARNGQYDLIIYDRCTPKTMPRANTMFVGVLPPTEDWNGEPTEGDTPSKEDDWVGAPTVIDWNRSHPLLAYVELSNLLVAKARDITPPAGATTLIDSTQGPLLVIAARDSYEDAVLAFPILDEENYYTNWFSTRGFPTFWLNTLEYFVAGANDPTRGQAKPNGPVELVPSPGVTEITVISPSGKQQKLTRQAEEPVQFQQTTEPGVYEVLEQDQVTQRFAVNLFDRAESEVRLRPAGANDPPEQSLGSLRIGYTDVKASTDAAPARKELWRWLLIAALVVLLAEWYIYNRRVYV